jgi:hypothetical protein
MPSNLCDSLPKMLPGVVCTQWVRCGRAHCRCNEGWPHGPYHYRFWREGGKLRKAYIRPTDLDDVQAQCKARQAYRRELAASWQQWRQLTALVKEVEKP